MCFRWWRRQGGGIYEPLGSEDSPEDAETARSPEEGAGWVSRRFFLWVDPLLAKGLHKSLDIGDMWATLPSDAAHVATYVFHRHLAESADSLVHPQGHMVVAMWRCYRGPLLRSGLLKLAHDIVMLSGPLILQLLLHHLQEGGSARRGLALALSLGGASLAQTLLVNAYFHELFRLCAHAKCALVDMVYRKSLRISCGARAGLGAGVVNNLQSNDVAKLWTLPQYLHMVWSGPFQILMVMGLLVRVIGLVSALAGLGVTMALIPIMSLLGNKLGSVRKQTMTFTDARVKVCTEVLTGIKAIKMYAWEEPYRDVIRDLRTKELAQMCKTAVLGVFSILIFQGAPIIITIAAFGTYTLLGNPLTADAAFPALALFNLLRFPIFMFPRQITDLINSGIALRRLQTFMEAEEVKTPSSPDEMRGDDPPVMLRVDHGTFAWDSSSRPLLHDIQLHVQPGQLVMVVGPVGCGKSSLLAALLSEMVQLQGRTTVRGSIAYTAQDPWIQNATVRSNITLGAADTLDRERYRAVLHACALGPDLASLPAGDATEIGEKGVNLSGGQRHRIALARACYADADIYLLDDPLSAVDAHVGRHLLSSCICGLLDGKTRVLVTHQLQYLSAADVVVVLEEGGITHMGSFPDLVAAGVDFHQFEAVAEQKEEEGTAGVYPDSVDAASPTLDLLQSSSGELASGKDAEIPAPDGDVSQPAQAAHSPRRVGEGRGIKRISVQPRQPSYSAGTPRQDRITEAEHRAVGKVDGALYMRYFAAWGPWYWLPISMVVLAMMVQGMQSGQNWWLAVWSAATVAPVSMHGTNFYLAVYSGVGLASLLVQVFAGLLLVRGTIHAACVLHDGLLCQVLRLPMSFFDSQPMGRLLNRFTKDTEAVDQQLADAVKSFVSCAANVAWCLVLIVMVTPAVAVLLLPLGFAYGWIQRRYIATSREIKRLDSVALSPIYSHFLETLSGLVTVRAFRQQQAFEDQNCDMLDASNRAWWPSQVVNRWLSVRLELLGTSVVLGSAVFATVLQPTSAGLAGLAITAALQATGFMSWAVRQTTEMEISMNSVERLTEYADLPTEAPAVIQANRPLPDWPTRGDLSVENLVVRYRPSLPPVLHGISFTVSGGSKLGIAGRTGCGKSTLMLALYRMVEPCGGRIVLDGIDTSTIGLYDLRSRLALVPQDPVVFSGTIRRNLDPFSNAGTGDEGLWTALEQAGLAAAVRALPGALDGVVSEGGGSLSQGQRQLLALARALLRRSRVLILDEATSNVDTATDAHIQKTIAKSFAGCTVLTIAHRLNTIVGSDAILVLDKGRLAEHGSPAELLAREGSAFGELMRETQQGGRKDD